MANSKSLSYLNIVNGSLQTKTYGFVGFTLVVVIILLIGAVRPTLLTITQINKDIREKTVIDTQLESKINNLATLSNSYALIRTDADALKLVFPTQGNFSYFMSNIEQITKQDGYDLASINFTSADKSNIKLYVLKPWSVRINVLGKKSGLIKLLKDIEALPMFPIINQVSYGNKQNDNGSTSFNIEMIIYRIDDPKFYD